MYCAHSEYEALIDDIEACIGSGNKDGSNKLKHRIRNAQVVDVAVKKGAAANHNPDDNVVLNKLKRMVTPTETAISNVSQTNIEDETKFGVHSVAISQTSKEHVHTFS